jgi:hypothetical protein
MVHLLQESDSEVRKKLNFAPSFRLYRSFLLAQNKQMQAFAKFKRAAYL